VPNALQFKQSLKIHSVSQYLQVINNTNYEQDEGAFLINFLKNSTKNNRRNNISSKIPVIPDYVDKIQINMNNVSLNILYSLAGYIIHTISKLSTVCKSCIDSAGSKTYDSTVKYSKLVRLRRFKSRTLLFVNIATFNFFYEMEIILRKYLPYITDKQYNLIKFFMEKMATIRCDALKTCCNLFKKIMKRYIAFRIKIDCKKGRLKNKVYNNGASCYYNIIKNNNIIK